MFCIYDGYLDLPDVVALASAADAERHWSSYGKIHNTRRWNLKQSRATKLVFLYHMYKVQQREDDIGDEVKYASVSCLTVPPRRVARPKAPVRNISYDLQAHIPLSPMSRRAPVAPVPVRRSERQSAASSSSSSAAAAVWNAFLMKFMSVQKREISPGLKSRTTTVCSSLLSVGAGWC